MTDAFRELETAKVKKKTDKIIQWNQAAEVLFQIETGIWTLTTIAENADVKLRSWHASPGDLNHGRSTVSNFARKL